MNLASAEPAGAAEGDILIAMFAQYNTSANTITGPSGWTELYSRRSTTYNGYFRVWWIRRGASAPSFQVSWTTTGNGYDEALVVCYSGCKSSGNPYNVAQSTSADGNNPANPNPPSVTTTVANTINVVLGCGWSGASSSWATPSGYTARDAGAAGDSWSVFEKALASATTEDCAAITGSATGANSWEALSIALEPATTGATGTATARTGVQALAAGVPGHTANATARTGVQALAAGVPGHTAKAASQTGVQARAAGVTARLAIAAVQTGVQARAVGVATHVATGTASAQTSVQARATGVATHVATATAQTAATASATGIATRAAIAPARAAARASATGIAARIATSVAAATTTSIARGLSGRLGTTQIVVGSWMVAAGVQSIASQYARPSSDITTTGWLTSTGLGTLSSHIDEEAADDGDYIYTETPDALAEGALSVVADPLTSSGYVYRVRAKSNVSGQAKIELRQGATLIGEWTQLLTTSYVAYAFPLSGAQADAITDHTTLRWRVTALAA